MLIPLCIFSAILYKKTKNKFSLAMVCGLLLAIVTLLARLAYDLLATPEIPVGTIPSYVVLEVVVFDAGLLIAGVSFAIFVLSYKNSGMKIKS